MTHLVNIKAGHDRDARLDQKLRRELGECVLKLLADDRTEDICLNPDTGDPPPPESWEGLSTASDRVTDPVDTLFEFRVAEGIQRIAVTSHRRVIVFPEFVVPQWTEATGAFWQLTLADIRSRGKTLLIGVGLPITGTNHYRNAVLTVGRDAATPFLQRVPVPVIMWNALKPERSVPLRLFGPGIFEVAGQWVAILVCYEQLLSWPILQSAAQNPTLIVGLANDNWGAALHLPKILAANL